MTLKEFDDKALDLHARLQKLSEPHPNGIECPECKSELWDSNPAVSLSSSPLRNSIHCPECGYTGYRLS